MTTTSSGDETRFEFGENWRDFLRSLDADKIAASEQALTTSLGPLAGKSFLDIGSGSGLSSLAARRLGARVHSFDYDPVSVACTRSLRETYCPGDADWHVEPGSALDPDYLRGLGQFDVVYSWGVLHHTGAMWPAIEYAIQRVKPGGLLLLALYNDQGLWSRIWWLLKYIYNKLPKFMQKFYANLTYNLIRYAAVLKNLITRPKHIFNAATSKEKSGRGMSRSHDIIDWMGGFPFEVVSLDVLRAYLAARGLEVTHCIPNDGLGCNEVTVRIPLDMR